MRSNHMRRSVLILTTALLIGLAAGCGTPAGGDSTEGLRIPDLTVELPRTLDMPAGRTALAKLPDALTRHGVSVESSSVTFGTSFAATGEALAEGGVQLAFLPAEAALNYGGTPILADARQSLSIDSADSADWNSGEPAQQTDGWTAGTLALVCVSPSEYGQNLASRTPGDLTWNELNNAHWGVLAADSVAGYRCLDLWLADNYAANDVSDLGDVTAYDSWEELLRAAAREEIDAFPLLADLRSDYRELWTMDASRTGSAGVHGFGRGEDICQEIRVIGVTPRLYTYVAAVAPEDETLNTPEFQAALEAALPDIFPDGAEQLSAIGAEHYAPVTAEDLDGLKRLSIG